MGIAAISRAPGVSRAEALLRGVRDDRDYANEVEAAALHKAILWLEAVAHATPAEPVVGPQIVDAGLIPVGGEGTPLFDEVDIAEFAAVMRMNSAAARHYLADAADLGWRLPRLRVAVKSGEVPAWKARRIAMATHGLSAAAARFIDRELVGRAAQVGSTRLQALVVEAEARFDPVAAQDRAERAAESRGVQMFPSTRATGVVDLAATLDHGDAEDVEAAIAMVAEELGRPGTQTAFDTLEVRRAKALGVIARRQLAGTLDSSGAMTTRVLHTYVHLPADPMPASGSEPAASAIVRVEKGNALLSASAFANWCAAAGAKVVVTPVLDLAAHQQRDGYVPAARMREQVIVRDETCVHPYCTRAARASDLDHIKPYRPAGPPGQTNTANLAALCRHHHRLKTHAGWSYTALEPGYYLWRSPQGRRFLRTPSGTVSLR